MKGQLLSSVLVFGITAGLGTMATGCKCGAPPCPPLLAAQTVDADTAPELQVAGDVGSTDGIFDPSVVYPAGAAAGAMAYSSVPTQESISTRIAVSSDQGATWRWVANANSPSAMTVPSTDSRCSGGNCSGTFIHEVPSLVFEPDDPTPDRRWKIFTHSYLHIGSDQLLYEHGYISLFTAAAPEGPWSSGEPLLGWRGPSPLSSENVAQLLTDTPALSDCIAFTEPGALALPGEIELALGCVSAGLPPRIRIVLLRSTDHARSFQHVGTLLTAQESSCAGASVPQINAANLFASGGAVYVSVTPAGDVTPTFVGYRGCVVYPVADVPAGKVARDANGAAVPVRRIDTAAVRFTGACTYAEGASAMGYLLPTLYPETTRRFRILRTGIGGP